MCNVQAKMIEEQQNRDFFFNFDIPPPAGIVTAHAPLPNKFSRKLPLKRTFDDGSYVNHLPTAKRAKEVSEWTTQIHRKKQNLSLLRYSLETFSNGLKTAQCLERRTDRLNAERRRRKQACVVYKKNQ